MSSSTHRVPLARIASAEVEPAQCKGRGKWWTRKEAEHAAAVDSESAAKAAKPALRLCGRCPAYELCKYWAELDKYTGLAAGAAYLNGRRKDPAKVRQKVTPPHERSREDFLAAFSDLTKAVVEARAEAQAETDLDKAS
jgi:hypothetical protein